MPISRLAVEKAFPIAGVDIRPMNSARVDTWLKDLEEGVGSLPKYQAALDELRRDLQGMAACVMAVVAEPTHALDLVESKGRIAVAALRLLDLATTCPALVSRLDFLGRAPLVERCAVVEHSGSPAIARSVDAKQLQSCSLSAERIDLAVALFTPLTEALQHSPIGDFAESVLNSLLVYSKASLRIEPGDRLVTAFAGLEMLLLRDENEAIAQNVGERMAFCSTKIPAERKKIAECVRAVYRLRSRVVHHGLAVEDSEIVEEFYMAAARFYFTVLENMRSFGTKDQFFEWIEKLKFA
jgi:hypothetical protein